MDETLETYRVITDRPEDPSTDAALDGLRAVLSAPAADAITTFTTVMPPGTHVGSHRHTAALAAGVMSGTLTFMFGADGTGRVVLEPGDYVWLAAGVMHDEETADGVEFIVGHIDPLETIVE
jgi:quercetin dioxygenase-like cupin family protein